MTIKTLTEIHHFLSRVVCHGDDQTRLLNLIDTIDLLIAKQTAKNKAA